MLYLIMILVVIGAIVTGVTNWLKKRKGNVISQSNVTLQSKEKNNEEKIYVVMDGNNKRELKYVSHIGSTMDYNSKSPYQGKRYDTYVDDLGYYWRSYDNGKSFVKEDYKHEIV